MNQSVFVGLMLMFPLSVAGAAALYSHHSHAPETKTLTLTPSDVSDLGYGVYRFENSEVVCYTSAQGLQCKFK
jgi:hypothetical protein